MAQANLVLIPITVLDRQGATVNGLQRENFKIVEDRKPQHIFSFSQQDLPCSVGIVIDSSGSMTQVFDAAKDTVRAFLDTSEERDEVFIMGVSSRPELHADLTRDVVGARNTIQYLSPGGSTAFLDTVYQALRRIRSGRNERKALFVISDGMDNDSSHSAPELMSLADEAGVQIYSISIGAHPANKKAIELRERQNGTALLDTLAEHTGGIHYSVLNTNQAAEAARKAGRAVRNQYMIGFVPESSNADRKWHKVKVKLDVPNLVIYARTGYYSK